MSLPLTIKLLTKIPERMKNSPGIPCWEKGKVEAWWETDKAGAWWETGKAGTWWETGKAGAWWGRSLGQAKEEFASQEEIAHEVSDHLAGQRGARDSDNDGQKCLMTRIAQSRTPSFSRNLILMSTP